MTRSTGIDQATKMFILISPYLLSSILGQWVVSQYFKKRFFVLLKGHQAEIINLIKVSHDCAGVMHILFCFRQVLEKTIWISADRANQLCAFGTWLAKESILQVIYPLAQASFRLLIKLVIPAISHTPLVCSKKTSSAVYHIAGVILVEADFTSVAARLPCRFCCLFQNFLFH